MDSPAFLYAVVVLECKAKALAVKLSFDTPGVLECKATTL